MLLWIPLINDKKYKFMSNTNLQIIAASDTVNTGYKKKITIDYVKLSLQKYFGCRAQQKFQFETNFENVI